MQRHEFVSAAKPYFPHVDGGMTPAFWHAVQTCYTSKRLDNVCAGCNRHDKFAAWVWNHQRIVMRLCRMQSRRNWERRDALRKQIAGLQMELDSLL